MYLHSVTHSFPTRRSSDLVGVTPALQVEERDMTDHRSKGRGSPISEAPLAKWTLIFLAIAYLAAFLLLPLLSVFVEALRHGIVAYGAALIEPDAIAAIKLTLIVSAIAVPEIG